MSDACEPVLVVDARMIREGSTIRITSVVGTMIVKQIFHTEKRGVRVITTDGHAFRLDRVRLA